jgi:hypothetical protein
MPTRYKFMSKVQWDHIYDIGRVNGRSVFELILEAAARSPTADELDIYIDITQHARDNNWVMP